MDATILLFLIQDGVTNGAIYALVGIALVLVFTVTRVIFVAQGEFVAYGALTLAMLDTGKVPGTAALLVVFGACAFLAQLWSSGRDIDLARLGRNAALNLLLPAAIAALTYWLAPMGPYLYAIAFRPIAEASVLTLLIVAIGVHLAMTGLGLVVFGAEGFRARPLTDMTVPAGPLIFTGQTLSVYAVTLVSMLALSFFFHKPLFGKALRATAVNRLGARLVGISASLSGSIAFGLAAILGALSGALIAPIATVFYDSGFIIGLKGFIAAIIGSLASYPLTALAAIGVGMVESFASFYASNLKEVIVFTLIIPVLIWLSFAHGHTDEED